MKATKKKKEEEESIRSKQLYFKLLNFKWECIKNAGSVVKSSSKLPFSKARSITIIVIGAIMEH